jgi:hypothetical protein
LSREKRKPETNFQDKPESITPNTDWTPAFAGVTVIETRGLTIKDRHSGAGWKHPAMPGFWLSPE